MGLEAGAQGTGNLRGNHLVSLREVELRGAEGLGVVQMPASLLAQGTHSMSLLAASVTCGEPLISSAVTVVTPCAPTMWTRPAGIPG